MVANRGAGSGRQSKGGPPKPEGPFHAQLVRARLLPLSVYQSMHKLLKVRTVTPSTEGSRFRLKTSI
jgi:hypothetical protein